MNMETIDEVLRSEQPVRTLAMVSPAAGVVVHGNANPGRIVEPTEHLFEVLDLSTVWVKAMVVEAETFRVRQGQPARVALAGMPGQTIDGQIDYVALQADPSSRAVPIFRVSLDDMRAPCAHLCRLSRRRGNARRRFGRGTARQRPSLRQWVAGSARSTMGHCHWSAPVV
jgi:hypothetical protein